MTRARTEGDPTRVLHVVEAFGGGVGAALLDYVSSTPEIEHHLLYAERADAPIDQSHLAPFAETIRMPAGHLRRVRTTRTLIRSREYDIVHAHSSFGGLYARLAVRRSAQLIAYTPHCYAFERRDIGFQGRAIFRLVEFGLSFNTTIFIACSLRELKLSNWTRGARAIFVPNVAPAIGFASDAAPENKSSGLKVVGAGRAAKQKDPDYFIECVRVLRAQQIPVEATWIGGDDDLRARAADHGIEVTGWQSRDEALALLARADVYLHTAAWEGFPVAVLESVSLGVPTVVRAISAFDGVGLPTISSPDEFASMAEKLTDEDALTDLLRQSELALASYTRSAQRAALLSAYSPKTSGSTPPVGLVSDRSR